MVVRLAPWVWIRHLFGGMDWWVLHFFILGGGIKNSLMFTSSGFKQPKVSEIDLVIIGIFIHVRGVFFPDVLYMYMFLFPICPDVWWHPEIARKVAASALHGEEEEEEVSRPGTLTPWTYFDNFPLTCHLVFNSLYVCNCAQVLFMFQYMIFVSYINLLLSYFHAHVLFLFGTCCFSMDFLHFWLFDLD